MPPQGRPTQYQTNDEIQNGTGYPKMVPGPRNAPGIGTGATVGASLAGDQRDTKQMTKSKMVLVIRKWYRDREMPPALGWAPAGAPLAGAQPDTQQMTKSEMVPISENGTVTSKCPRHRNGRPRGAPLRCGVGGNRRGIIPYENDRA
ncbi:hypothetical protein [Runella sp.]|uniref:hypothetical protein n=1 Tax=Runella sp. TaxID=1960881 RepID=UPI003017C31F